MHCSRGLLAKCVVAGSACVVALLIHPLTIARAQMDTTKPRSDDKPKIIFNNHSIIDSNAIGIQTGDSAKPKIIFKNMNGTHSGRIGMISSEQFTVDGESYLLGEDGVNLKQVMRNNPKAVEMVESAYGKRGTGTALMIVGGAIAVAGYILPSTWVKLDEERHQTYSQTWYWFPGVTAGLIVGGIGYVQFNSLTSRLYEAIDCYNQSLLDSSSRQ